MYFLQLHYPQHPLEIPKCIEMSNFVLLLVGKICKALPVQVPSAMFSEAKQHSRLLLRQCCLGIRIFGADQI